MTDVCTRRLDTRELDVVEPLWNALREHHASVSPHLGAPRSRADSWKRRRAQYEQWLSEPEAFLLLAALGERAVGYAMVHLRAGSPTWPVGERAGEVETLSVYPDERGRGVGTMLLRAVQRELAALGVDELSLHVISANQRAMSFYERHGLRPFAQWLAVGGFGARENPASVPPPPPNSRVLPGPENRSTSE
ncbi:MAG TPA: GNAT family N-acetyltransferase [Solirubrobacteraceae bacterium]|nr:GNAT family N-acetyltransferase [Solirubrobacteraceae bacterium]